MSLIRCNHLFNYCDFMRKLNVAELYRAALNLTKKYRSQISHLDFDNIAYRRGSVFFTFFSFVLCILYKICPGLFLLITLLIRTKNCHRSVFDKTEQKNARETNSVC